MSRYHSKGVLDVSSLTTSPRDLAECSAGTVFMAVSKLKLEQDRLLEQHKRNRVLGRQISKEQANSWNRARKSEYFQKVKHSAWLDLEMKKQKQNKNIQELKARYSLNMRLRQLNKKMLESVRQSFHHANHQLYEEIRQKKMQNQKLIKTERSKYMQSRILSRVAAREEYDIRRKSIQNFHESRSSQRKSSKSQEIAEMIRKSQEKRKLYGDLAVKNSRIREDKLLLSRLSSSSGSVRNPEKQSLK